MRICLVNPPIREWAESNIPPLGPLILSSVLKREGHEVKIMDINGHRWSEEEVEKQIVGDEFDIYGVGGLVTTYSYNMWLADTIKKCHPGRPVICGGALTTASPDLLLKRVDAIIVGEGEGAVLDAVRDVEQGNLKRIYHREPVKNLDTLPQPDYENLGTLHVYLKAAVGAHNPGKWKDGKSVGDVKTLPLLSGRGCQFSCKFCSSHYLGPGYRLRSIPNIIKEARELIDRYGVEYFHFMDELTMSSRARCLYLCQELRKLDVAWGCPVRIDILDHKLLHVMRDSGCIHIGTGVESFSPNVLRSMNKPMNVDRVKTLLKQARKLMDAQYTLILGYPGEDRDTLKETVKGVEEVGFPPEQVFFPTPYPGTELYAYASRMGLIDEGSYLELLSGHEQRDFLFNFSSLSREGLLDAKDEIMEVS